MHDVSNLPRLAQLTAIGSTLGAPPALEKHDSMITGVATFSKGRTLGQNTIGSTLEEIGIHLPFHQGVQIPRVLCVNRMQLRQPLLMVAAFKAVRLVLSPCQTC